MAAISQRGPAKDLLMNENDDDSITIVPGMNDSPKEGSTTASAPGKSCKSAPQGATRKVDTRSIKTIIQSPGKKSAQAVDLISGIEESSMSSSTVLSNRSGTSRKKNEDGKTLFSPATQTLNALSQNMDDLRYDLSSVMKAQEEPPEEETAKKPAGASAGTKSVSSSAPDPENCLPLLEWKTNYRDRLDWLPISFDAAKRTDSTMAGLGVVIQREQFFAVRKQSGKNNPQEGKMHCQILRVLSGEWGEKCGVYVGDWVCRPRQSPNSLEETPVLAQFSEVQEWATMPSFKISVLRLKKRVATKPNGNKNSATSSKEMTLRQDKEESESLTASPSEQDAAKAMVAMVSAPPPEVSLRPDMGSLLEAIEHSERASPPLQKRLSTVSGKENHLPQDWAPSQDEVVPFCKLCNYSKRHGGRRGHFGRKPRMHHAWCPQGTFFDNNGSKELLDRIYQGQSMSCPGCDKEYQSGKLEPVKSHATCCLDNQKRLKKEQQNREEKEEQNKKRQTSERRNAPLKKRRRAMEPSASSGEDEQESEYRPRPKKQQQQTITVSTNKTRDSAPSSNSTKSPKPKSDPTKSKASKSTSADQVRRVTPPPADPAQKAAPSVVGVTAAAQRNVSETNVSDCTATLKSRWESTDENPWGDHGHQAGDIVLYGPQTGLGHHETLLPSPRYMLYPFAPGSNYRTTHCTPQEGHTLLCLSRDPSGNRPWGFAVTRDEFGQACLVEYVQPMTAASGAKALGSEEILGLRVHDMILMVNGYAVGGMTEVGLELELKTCGPRLTLAVSRYKHAEAAAEQRAAMERNMLRVMDKSCRDERLLGWHEVGNAAIRPAALASTGSVGGHGVVDCPQGRDTMNVNMPVMSPLKISETSLQDEQMEEPGAEERPDHLPDDTETGLSSLASGRLIHRQVVEEKKEEEYPSNPVEGATKGDESSAGEFEEEWEDDQNAWNGCVCGEIHKKTTKVFWIQCDDCDSWFDVAEKCVGFTEDEAEDIGRWICWACGSDGEESDPAAGECMTPPIGMHDAHDVLEEAAKPASSTSARKPSSKAGSVASSQGSEQNFASKKPSKAKISKSTEHGTAPGSIASAGDRSTAPQKSGSLASKKSGSKKKPKVYKDGRPSWKDRQLMKTNEGNLLSNAQPVLLRDGTYRKPTGRVPKGFQWDKHRGLWAPRRKPGTSSQAVTSDEKIPEKKNQEVHSLRIQEHVKTDNGRKAKSNDVAACKPVAKKPSSSEESISGTGDVHMTFKEGDLVYVEHHAWPGWNCEGGIGRIGKSYLNDDGDRLYDIKYVVGRSERGILAEFVYSYSFG